jgi:LCCL domain
MNLSEPIELAVAAVHAGAVKTGQTGVVKVQLVAPPPAFAGTTRDGVSSQDYGPFPEAFRFVK